LEHPVFATRKTTIMKVMDIFKLKNPKGRFSSISYKDSFIVIDYAHTPQALERVLGSIKSIYPDFKVSVVFGCGGDRDTLKRPIMGKIASDFVTSGKIYLTSDNTKSEKPEKIIDDIRKGIEKHNFEVIPDRKMAIEMALSNIKEKEIDRSKKDITEDRKLIEEKKKEIETDPQSNCLTM
jgi:UDP-N-acetylmuramoyl-L-alanyl-D-glutamate--2,6-diaminopimelate ligase